MAIVPVQWPDKRPGDKAYWQLDWSDQLGLEDPADTISTVTWVVPAGITRITAGKLVKDAASKIALIWLEDGTAGQYYAFVCTITTANGITLERGVTLYVRAP
jgi:hypothetical protein